MIAQCDDKQSNNSELLVKLDEIFVMYYNKDEVYFVVGTDNGIRACVAYTFLPYDGYPKDIIIKAKNYINFHEEKSIYNCGILYCKGDTRTKGSGNSFREATFSLNLKEKAINGVYANWSYTEAILSNDSNWPVHAKYTT